MAKQDIIVIGSSAGGVVALEQLVSQLPQDLQASLFVVSHLLSTARSVLPRILDAAGPLTAAQAIDREEILPGRIYVAIPDHHLLLEQGCVRVTKGPKENRTRPAIDPLFRSAAYVYKSRVIGVVLTGCLDDGTAGLWTIKMKGGIAVVQNPKDAQFPFMPESALTQVAVDHCVPLSEMAQLLTRLTREQASEVTAASMEDNKRIEVEVNIAAEDIALKRGIMELGEVSPFTCPECQGVLTQIKEGKILRFRCHTGHAFSASTLLSEVTESIENTLWSTVRAMEESIMLLDRMGNHLAETDKSQLSELYFKKAREAEQRAQIVRQTIMQHERLSADNLPTQAEKA